MGTMDTNVEVINIKPISIDISHSGLSELLEKASSLAIITATDADNGSFIRSELKRAFKTLDEKRKGMTSPLDLAKSRIMDSFKKPLDLLKATIESVDRKILDFQTKERKRVEDANREKQRLVDIKVAAEKAELKRIADEAKAKADAIQKELDEQKRLREESEKKASEEKEKGVNAILERNRLRKEAEDGKEREKLQIEEIERLKQEAKIAEDTKVKTEVVPVEKMKKITGLSTKRIQRYRVVNIEIVDRQYLIVNDDLLSDIATRSEGKAVIAGIEFYSEEILASRKV